MLVLSRKFGERIFIGDDIVITVVSTGSDRVRLGIAAPANVPIHREEVFQRLCREDAVEQLAPNQSPFFVECA